MTDTTAIPAEALEAARTAIRSRWRVQIAPNTATALARVVLEAAAPILRAEERAAVAADIHAQLSKIDARIDSKDLVVAQNLALHATGLAQAALIATGEATRVAEGVDQ